MNLNFAEKRSLKPKEVTWMEWELQSPVALWLHSSLE